MSTISFNLKNVTVDNDLKNKWFGDKEDGYIDSLISPLEPLVDAFSKILEIKPNIIDDFSDNVKNIIKAKQSSEDAKTKSSEETVNKTTPVNKDLNTGKTGAAKIVENLNNHSQPQHTKANEVPKDIDKLSIIRQHISKDNGAEFTFKNQQQIDNVADLISNPITKSWLAKCGYDGDLNNPQFFLLNGQPNVIYKTKYPDAGYDMLLSARTNIPGHVVLIEFNTLTKIFHICPVKKDEVFKKNSKKNKGKK